jgi:hypothetical protein
VPEGEVEDGGPKHFGVEEVRRHEIVREVEETSDLDPAARHRVDLERGGGVVDHEFVLRPVGRRAPGVSPQMVRLFDQHFEHKSRVIHIGKPMREQMLGDLPLLPRFGRGFGGDQLGPRFS